MTMNEFIEMFTYGWPILLIGFGFVFCGVAALIVGTRDSDKYVGLHRDGRPSYMCRSTYLMAPIFDQRCILPHHGEELLHFNKAGWSWDDADAEYAEVEAESGTPSTPLSEVPALWGNPFPMADGPLNWAAIERTDWISLPVEPAR